MQTIKNTSVSRLLYLCAKENFALVGKVVAVGIVARITEILSFLLPVKAFLISARKKVPGFFPDFFHQYDYRIIILVLAGLAIVFYVISYICQQYTEGRAGKIAISSLGSSFNPDEVSNRLMPKIAGRIFSSYVECFFMFTVISTMALLSPFLLISLIPYYVIIALIIKKTLDKGAATVLCDNNRNIEEESEYNFSIYADLGFAIGLVTALVISFYANNAEMIYLFVCFILMRRSSGSVNKIIKNYVFLRTRLIRSSC